MDLQEIERLTIETCEARAISHARRLIALTDQISAGLSYDREALLYAIYLHDWGAYGRYKQSGVEHALRSYQIAKSDILPQCDLTPEQVAVILEAIEFHDYRDYRPIQSTEAVLLREADFLDFLGIIGLAREFCKGPQDLGTIYERMCQKMDLLRDRFSLPVAKEMAQQRLAEMEQAMQALVAEGYGAL